MFEKKRVIGLYKYIQNVNVDNPMTWGDIDIKEAPMSEVFKKHGLEENTIDFMGHAVALHYQDTYLYEPAIDTIQKM